jgi:hypothetical protein
MRVSRSPDEIGVSRPSSAPEASKPPKTLGNHDKFERGPHAKPADPSRSYRIAGHITMAASVAALVGLSPFVGIAPAALLAVTGQALLLKGGYDPQID